MAYIPTPKTQQANGDAESARRLAEGAFNPHSDLYRQFGPDRLLAAAQVYATLATRG